MCEYNSYSKKIEILSKSIFTYYLIHVLNSNGLLAILQHGFL